MDNKIKLRDKLNEYEAGEVDIEKLEPFLEQQRERDKQMSTIMNQKPIDKRKVTTNKSSIAHIAEQGIKLGKTIKKKANNILTNGYTNGLEQLIKSENYDESIYSMPMICIHKKRKIKPKVTATTTK